MAGKIKIKVSLEDRLKAIFKQLRGEVEEDTELIPEAAISGTGSIYCYQPFDKIFVKIERGIKIFILDEKEDSTGKILIYTFTGHIVKISAEEIIFTGFD